MKNSFNIQPIILLAFLMQSNDFIAMERSQGDEIAIEQAVAKSILQDIEQKREKIRTIEKEAVNLSYVNDRKIPTNTGERLTEKKKHFDFARELITEYYRQMPYLIRQWEFSNQSNQLAIAWIPSSAESWDPVIIGPMEDSGPIYPSEGNDVYLQTSDGFFAIIMLAHYDLDLYALPKTLTLIKQVPSNREGYMREIKIKSIPYNEATDIMIIVNPNGSVNIVKRQRQGY